VLRIASSGIGSGGEMRNESAKVFMAMSEQTFFVVGTAKAGTSSLYEYLGAHPEVHMCPHKDVVCYFCRDWGLAVTEEKYREWLLPPGDYKVAGDVCHAYMTDEAAASNMHRMFPDAKIIMILRNPADRAFSMYNWLIANGYEFVPTFEQALKEEGLRIARNIRKDHRLLQHGGTADYLYFHSGLYADQIARYQQFYAADRILFLKFDDLCADTEKVVRQVYSFIGVDPDFKQKIEIHNEKRAVRSVRFQYFVRRAAFPFFGPRVGAFLLWLNTKNGRSLKLPPQTRARLIEQYRPDIEKTADMTGLDLSDWLAS